MKLNYNKFLESYGWKNTFSFVALAWKHQTKADITRVGILVFDSSFETNFFRLFRSFRPES